MLMKKLFSLLLSFLLVLTVFPMAISATDSDTLVVNDADELTEAIRQINEEELPLDTNITLGADIDLSDVSYWMPLIAYEGVFDGRGHKITGLSQSIVFNNTVTDAIDQGENPGGQNFYRWSGTMHLPNGSEEANQYNCFGYCGIATLFVKLTGTVKNLTVENGSISLDANYNKNNLMDLAYIAGYALDATFENVHAIGISVSTASYRVNENQGHMGYAAIIAGRAGGNTTFTNCTVDETSTVDTSKTPRMSAAQILGAYDANGATDGSINTDAAGDLTFNYCTANGTVTVSTDTTTSLMYKPTPAVRSDGIPGVLFKTNNGGNLIYGTSLSDSDTYTFYYQTRENKDDPTAKDYRVICIADRTQLTGNSALAATITFTNGSETKTFTPETSTVYRSVKSTAEGFTDVYYAAEGDVVFGWVITGVPADYQKDPTVSITAIPMITE